MLRVSRELPSRSGVGAMFVNRTATGSLARSDDWNRTLGADGRLGVGEHLTVSGFARAHRRRRAWPGATTRTTSTPSTTTASTGRGSNTGMTGEDFNPEVGFLENADGYRRYLVRFEETMRQERDARAGDSASSCRTRRYTRYDYLDGGLQNAELHVDNHWDWENGNFFTAGAQRHVGRPARAVRGLSRHHRARRASMAGSGSTCAPTPTAASGSTRGSSGTLGGS